MAGDDTIPYYHQALDWQALVRDYPPPPAFARITGRLSADALRALQNERFMQRMAEAWQTSFYRARWEAAGLEPGDIRARRGPYLLAAAWAMPVPGFGPNQRVAHRR